jgi:hypothetical protein
MYKREKYFFLTDGFFFAIASAMVLGSKFILDLSYRSQSDFNIWVNSSVTGLFYSSVFGFMTIGIGLEWKSREFKSPILALIYCLYVSVILCYFIFDFDIYIILVFLNVISNILLVVLLGILRFHFPVSSLTFYSLSIFFVSIAVYYLKISYVSYHMLLSFVLLIPILVLSNLNFKGFSNFFVSIFKTGIYIYLVNVVHSYFLTIDKSEILGSAALNKNDLLLINNFAYLIYPSGLFGTLFLSYYKKGRHDVFSISQSKIIFYSILSSVLFYTLIFVINPINFSNEIFSYLLLTAIFYSLVQFNNLVFFTLNNRELNLVLYTCAFIAFFLMFKLFNLRITSVIPAVLSILLTIQYLSIKSSFYVRNSIDK